MNILLVFTLLLTPAYIIKFNLLGFPTNVLMAWVGMLWIFFGIRLIVKHTAKDFIASSLTQDTKTLSFIALFLLAGIISLAYPTLDMRKLGQFIVLFLQPISLFFIYRYEQKNNPKLADQLLVTCYLLLAACGLYALLQYTTRIGLPAIYWGNSEEPKRALSFFVHPNFYALFITPLLAFLIPDTWNEFSIYNFQFSKIWKAILWLIGALGLLLSLSRAGWIGLAAAAALYVILAGNRTIRRMSAGAIVVMAVVILATPNLRYRLLLPFYGEKSAVSRVSLWHTGWKGIKESPVLGLGLTGFSQHWDKLNTDPNLDTHNFPHNVFLNLWVETGLLGLISITGLIGLHIWRGLAEVVSSRASASERGDLTSEKIASSKDKALSPRNDTLHRFAFPIALFLIAFLVQGLLDNPYFKNDLAALFWIIISFI